MEARGNRTQFEDLKYNTANWRYGWTTRDYNKGKPPAIPAYDNMEPLPLYFPSVYAFLCSEEYFNWEVEVYKVETIKTENGTITDLTVDLERIVPVRVKGLGIPSPTSETLRFSEKNFVPLNDKHQRELDLIPGEGGSLPPSGVGITGYKYWTEEPKTMERVVNVQANPLGLTDLTEFREQWKFKAHGRLIDMAVYVN